MKFAILMKHPRNVAPALIAFSLALGYLLPTLTRPWPGYYHQALFCIVVLIWMVYAAPSSKPYNIDFVTIAIVLLSTIPIANHVFGLIVYASEAALISFYILLSGLSFAFSRVLLRSSGYEGVDVLFAAIVFAGFTSVGMALIQRLDLDLGGVMVAPIPVGGRSFANLGQPNMLATLLTWSMVGLLWALVRKSLRPGIWLFAASFLALGVVASQSRTGALQVLLVCLASADLGWRRGSRNLIRCAVLLFIFFCFLSMVWREFGPHAMATTQGLDRVLLAGKRPQIWQMALSAIAARPLMGYGWYQGHAAFGGQLELFPPMFVSIAHSHNIFLDLMVWNGVIIGGAISVAIIFGLFRICRWRGGSHRFVLGTGLLVFFLHCLTELPYVYINFLIPVSMFGGFAVGGNLKSLSIAAPRWVMVFIGVVGLTLVSVATLDYWRIEDDHLRFRIRQARIGDLTDVDPPKPLILKFLQEPFDAFRIEPHPGMPKEEIKRLEMAAQRFPSAVGLRKFALAEALNGNLEEARFALKRICLTNSDEVCDYSKRWWESRMRTP